MAHILLKATRRRRPRYGWFAFLLLLSVLATLLLAVVEVDWAPGARVIVPMVLAGFFFSHWVQPRVRNRWLTWFLIAGAGLGLAIAALARLWPDTEMITQSASWGDFLSSLFPFWRQQLALFFDRLSGWLRAVSSGGRSTETLPFVLILALAGWFLAAILNWSAYHRRRPLLGLTLIGTGLALNTFYGQSGLYWVVVFVGLAVTTATYLDYLYREEIWELTGVDYSTEVRTDLLIYVGGVSIGIMALAMAIPAINVRAIAEAFQRQSAVVEAEKTLERAFSGVRVARPATPRTDEGAPDPGQLPRGFLLGYPPELSETVVMTATLGIVGDPPGTPPDPRLKRFHWRSISYEVYTGQGWERSTTEREEFFPAGAMIPPPDMAALTGDQVLILNQAVDWTFDNRRTRYTIGVPVRFSHDAAVFWRGRADMIGVQGRNNPPRRYTAMSQIGLPPEDILLAAELGDVPAEIMARYTALPDTVPDRVLDLARQVTGLTPPLPSESGGPATPTARPWTSPYEQARAIETFLHQYPYTLEVGLPPANVDMVDYFLFDLQRGYCDYFASAMVVMARAIGLPARLAVGYLPQPEDGQGVQTIRQANAHSWAEIYFAGVGWIEFEPTPPFAPPVDTTATPPASDEEAISPVATLQPIDIPEREPERGIPWYLWLGVILLATVAWRLGGKRWLAQLSAPAIPLDDIQFAYARLQDSAAGLGYPIHVGQTPLEFAAGFAGHLQAGIPLDESDRAGLIRDIDRLTQLFNARQYGRDDSLSAGIASKTIRNDLQRAFRKANWRRRLGRFRVN